MALVFLLGGRVSDGEFQYTTRDMFGAVTYVNHILSLRRQFIQPCSQAETRL